MRSETKVYWDELGAGRLPAPTIQRAAPVQRLPFVRDSVTSKEAAEAAKPRANYGEQAVLRALRATGQAMTDEQIQDESGLDPSTERPRRVALARQGLIYRVDNDGRTRSGRSAQRWAVVPKHT